MGAYPDWARRADRASAPYTPPVSQNQPIPRPIHAAVLLAVGSELTTGETRDTNSGDIARWLGEMGVEVLWVSSLPDRLETVTRALRDALAAADLVVTTGGLGPTPDDLTRESIAAMMGESVTVDPELETWLRGLFARRNMTFAELNLKQAWLIPSASAIPNERGTAPGWWVDTADGRVIVALPGPPREMSGMWTDGVLPRLRARGSGRETVVRTLRLAGIGESMVAAHLGEALLRATNPVVATYAKVDSVDVRITAVAEGGRSAAELAEEAEAAVFAAVGDHVWGHDGETWSDVLARQLDAHGWTAALVEMGTGGSAGRLLGEAPWLLEARSLRQAREGAAGAADAELPLPDLAAIVRDACGATIGLALRAVETGKDTHVDMCAAGPWGVETFETLAFLGGAQGRIRAANSLATFLHDLLKRH
jgi:nicotinamide-nucleotide amidase